MDAIFVKSLYKAFKDAEADFIAGGLPPVLFLDKYRGQPSMPEKFEMFPLPAIFYQFVINWQKQGGKNYGTMTATFHVLLDATWESSSIATNQAEGLKQIQLLQFIRQTLDSVRSANTGAMLRVVENDVEEEVVVYQTMTYNTNYTEPTVSVGGTGKVDATPDNWNPTTILKEKL